MSYLVDVEAYSSHEYTGNARSSTVVLDKGDKHVAATLEILGNILIDGVRLSDRQQNTGAKVLGINEQSQ